MMMAPNHSYCLIILFYIIQLYQTNFIGKTRLYGKLVLCKSQVLVDEPTSYEVMLHLLRSVTR